MNYFSKEIQTNEKLKRTAGIKARDDADDILKSHGWRDVEFAFDTSVKNSNLFSSGLYHFRNSKIWREKLRTLKKGDNLLIQFPVKNHSVFLNQAISKVMNKGVGVYLLIHDLEIIRVALKSDVGLGERIRISMEEKSLLQSCTGMIVHNEAMKKMLGSLGFDETKMVVLDIFDYLIPGYEEKATDSEARIRLDQPVIIAGNLNRHKAGYVYQLPANQRFNLYGIGYEDQKKEHVQYFGSFPPDDLPFALEGSFGLVWDGDSADTCAGVYGQYLKVNNPHKTSLYLASGIPVIVWKEAAMADFVEKHRVGLAVESLSQIAERISALSEEDYAAMLANVRQLSVKLRQGGFLQSAMDKVVKKGKA